MAAQEIEIKSKTIFTLVFDATQNIMPMQAGTLNWDHCCHPLGHCTLLLGPAGQARPSGRSSTFYLVDKQVGYSLSGETGRQSLFSLHPAVCVHLRPVILPFQSPHSLNSHRFSSTCTLTQYPYPPPTPAIPWIPSPLQVAAGEDTRAKARAAAFAAAGCWPADAELCSAADSCAEGSNGPWAAATRIS